MRLRMDALVPARLNRTGGGTGTDLGQNGTAAPAAYSVSPSIRQVPPTSRIALGMDAGQANADKPRDYTATLPSQPRAQPPKVLAPQHFSALRLPICCEQSRA